MGRQQKILEIAKRVICATVVFIFALKPIGANAEEERLRFSSVMKFAAGITAGFLIHEGGHAFAGWVTGTDMDWEFGDINQPLKFTEDADSDSEGVAINAAGLVSQAAAAEIILQVDAIDKNDAFVRGMMAWNVLNPILYTIDYWFIHRTNKKNGDEYQGDLQGIERYSNKTNANAFAVGMVAIACSQGYRFMKTQTWAPDWMKGDTHTVSFAPLPSGGMFLTYKYTF